MTGTIAVILIFSIPILGTITSHFEKKAKINAEVVKDQLELEKLRHENFIIETEKMKLQLEQMKLESSKEVEFHHLLK
ncbi:hypothetical protein [Psychrobacillus vulpis]|uniref:Uncharacterized protein n=1 Tax=Psychrobacillus vulpis TaxID=2325572 RepID=A0A544TTH6_9BACI|nr:hypothetical protein [Psychrobacillus vulpis]TQR20743.1 hypothetical protein FG384_06530 [Psychrobacillus vulpis]